MNTLERRFVEFGEVRAKGDKVTASGHALTWDDVYTVGGAFDERVARGAVDGLLDDPDIAFLWNHNADIVLARVGSGTLRVTEDDEGVFVEADLPKSAVAQREALERGDVRHQSWGFTVREDVWEKRDGLPDLRTITKVDRIFDFSAVVFAANPNTDVALRSRDHAAALAGDKPPPVVEGKEAKAPEPEAGDGLSLDKARMDLAARA